jgi:putative ABC transport system substrate-binding protein
VLEAAVNKTTGKKIISLALGTTLFALSSFADAQQKEKIPKIGWLRENGSGAARELIERELRELGYVVGKNIAFEHRSAQGKVDRLPALADELIRLKVDVLIANSSPASLALKTATRTIPIVFFSVGDPVALALVDSLARPGGNITGFTSITAVLSGKRLELLKETVPKLSRVAMLWDPRDAGAAQQWKESQLPARELGLLLHSMEVSSADKFESGFKEATKAGSTALTVTLSPLASSNQKPITDLAAKNQLPSIQNLYCGVEVSKIDRIPPNLLAGAHRAIR